MTETMEGPRVHMMAVETIKAGVLLQTYCRPIDGGRYHRYEKGWDDDKIARETSERLNGSHVARLRKQLEMKLEPNVNNLGVKGIQSRYLQMDAKIDALSQRTTDDFKDLDERITDNREANARAFADLNAKIDLLIENHNKVCDVLSLNKVHDLRDYRVIVE